MSHKFVFLVYDQCHSSNVLAPIDMLNTANALWRDYDPSQLASPLFTWGLISVDGQPVQTSTGLRLAVDGDLDMLAEADVFFIPALHHRHAHELSNYIAQSSVLLKKLRALNLDNKTIAACCTGTVLLAAAGLLNSKRATTSWWLEDFFKSHYPEVQLTMEQMVTHDKNLLCTGAGFSCLYLILKLIEHYSGNDFAVQCAQLLLIDAKHLSQINLMTVQGQQRHNDVLISQAQTWIRENLHKNFTTKDIADSLSISERTLIRRFKTAINEKPTTYLQRVRIETAKRLLETTQLKIEAVVAKVGYSDMSSFRRLFKKHTRLSPREYRQRFNLHALPDDCTH